MCYVSPFLVKIGFKNWILGVFATNSMTILRRTLVDLNAPDRIVAVLGTNVLTRARMRTDERSPIYITAYGGRLDVSSVKAGSTVHTHVERKKEKSDTIDS